MKIGDTVTWLFSPKKDLKYIIMATREQPYMGLGASPYNQPTSVKEGYDFLIVENEIVGFGEFQHVQEKHLIKSV